MSLSEEHIKHLNNIAYGGLMKLSIPDHMENYLSEQGYVRRVIGGLVATEDGKNALVKWYKEGGR